MPDLQRVGGVSAFLRVGHMAEARDIPMASYLFSEMSAQVLCALSNALCVEYMPWFSPLYNETLGFRDGNAACGASSALGFSSQKPSSALKRDEAAIAALAQAHWPRLRKLADRSE